MRRLAAALLMLFPFMSAPLSASTWTDPRSIPLIDQRGQAFRLEDLGGTPIIITFVAARCTDACPIANASFAVTYHRLRHDHIPARFLTITLDPDHDTSVVMASVARPFGIPRDAWRFATGSPANVRELMRSFGVESEKDARGIPDSHSSFVYVLDRNVLLAKTLLLSTDLTPEIEEAISKLPVS